MSIVGIKELKSHLTQYLRKTKAGEEIVITERGKPIAVIRPTKETPSSRTLEAKLTELASDGKIILPRKKFLSRIPSIKISGPLISDTVLEERR